MRRLSLPPALHRPMVMGLSGLCASLVMAALSSTAVARPPAPAVEPVPATPSANTIELPGDAKPGVRNSEMDAQLFYQSLVAEMQVRQGQPGVGYQIYLETARRRGDDQLFRRAVDIALQARAGEQALSAAQAWRDANPRSLEAAQFVSQLLLVFNRVDQLAPPLSDLITLTPADQQAQVLGSLPRSLQRIKDRQAAATLIDQVTAPWREGDKEKVEAWVASGEGWAQARQPDKALAALKRALTLDPVNIMAGLQAVELTDQNPDAQALVDAQLLRSDAPPLVRLAYARKLAARGQFETAEGELKQLIQLQPQAQGTRILLAAVQLERKKLDEAEATLRPLTQLIPKARQESSEALSPELEQAALMQAQIAEQRKQFGQALNWLQRADPTGKKMSVQAQRARLMASQGQLASARALIRALPEDEPRDGVAKVQAEAGLLRDARQWREAHRVLGEGVERFPEVSELLYDQAMMADKLGDHDDMERLLKRLIEIDPDNANALNALGYSLADRGVRLDEAVPGTGLGLAVVHGILREHGAALRVSSQPGVGTVFTAVFPGLKDAVPDALPAPVPPAPAGPGRTWCSIF